MNRPCRVLLVDDQPIIHAAVRRLLADCDDIELHGELDGSRALAHARALQPELILQDLQLDELDGLELLRAYRDDAQLAHVPVLVLSAAEEPLTKAEVFARGGNDYVVKLPSALELAARVRYHVASYRAQRDREAAFVALLESRRVLEERNREIESRKLQLEQLNRELAESAVTDALTGLHNRRYLRTYLERPLLESAQRDSGLERRHPLGEGMTLFLLDLDHFKRVNDEHGHDAGDAVLIEMGRRLRQLLRVGDAVLRWGGEEFLLVARGVCSEAASHLAERLLEVVRAAPVRIGHSKSVVVTASIGFAPLPFPAPHGARFSVDHVIGLADAAAYLSKRAGRACAHGVLPIANATPLDPINEPITSPEFLDALDGHRLRLLRVVPERRGRA
jgi:two-component system chemotaxis family response regulator WspR